MSATMDCATAFVLLSLSCGVLSTLTSNAIRDTCQDQLYSIPVVINTWGPNGFLNATIKAWEVLKSNSGSALDAVERGCSTCEELQCDRTVGFGGSPDEGGETTLDAMIMDGATLNVGAVSALRRVKSAISVARRVLENTAHTMLAGSQATKFALRMGFREESLGTTESKNIWKNWKARNCQPNFWRNVSPNPKQSCGPYAASSSNIYSDDFYWKSNEVDFKSHDTIGMIAIDLNGQLAAGTTTNGARHKIPGRVGDSPIPGSGSYADQDVGGAAATGDGDVMMRFLPSFLAVEEMRRGATPENAGKTAIQRIVGKYPTFKGAIVVLRKDGAFGAACHGLENDKFPFSVANQILGKAVTLYVDCS